VNRCPSCSLFFLFPVSPPLTNVNVCILCHRQKALKLLSERLGGNKEKDSKRPLLRPDSPDEVVTRGSSEQRNPSTPSSSSSLQMSPSTPNLSGSLSSQRNSDNVVIPVTNEAPPGL
jgi:hypothetical protein